MKTPPMKNIASTLPVAMPAQAVPGQNPPMMKPIPKMSPPSMPDFQ